MVMPFGACEPVNDGRPEGREEIYICIFEFVTCTLKSNSIFAPWNRVGRGSLFWRTQATMGAGFIHHLDAYDIPPIHFCREQPQP